jgi:dTDP-4-dehydrorhamnose reductase
MNILVLGATGLLGSAMYRRLSTILGASVSGTIRTEAARLRFAPALRDGLVVGGDLEQNEGLTALFTAVQPDVVVNCLAVGRPLPPDPMRSILVYSVLPQRLSVLCRRVNARLIQISSDGVFAGSRGGYTEDDLPDATDVYGVAKQLGEVVGSHAINLRTSIIGHELQPGSGLIDWFLAQHGSCRCFTRAIFSGFPTVVLADVVKDQVIPRPELHGIYHLATAPISKFNLLKLVAERYGKEIDLIADDRASPDRSLVSTQFQQVTGYHAPEWPVLIDAMYSDNMAWRGYDVY